MFTFSPGSYVVSPLCIPGVLLWVQISSYYKDTSQIGLGPTIMASFELSHLFKALFPNATTFRSAGASMYEILGGDTIQIEQYCINT